MVFPLTIAESCVTFPPREISEVFMQKDHLEILLESIDSKFQITLEAFQSLNNKIDTKIDDLRVELKEDIAVVDSKVMGLSKRLDSVEKRLSDEIAEVKTDLAEVKVDVAEIKTDLAAHRNNTEMHSAQPKRSLKRA
jgi:septal ring factor EnvC (AmiA/AmiB activator)